ncbi:CAP domain-containing protein [Thalassobius sp. S69A]|uniref:CAP domain-containing protein n=1 Tax=unclassified Thalassovita TaxID=2619711 RepID=UPI003C7B1838
MKKLATAIALLALAGLMGCVTAESESRPEVSRTVQTGQGFDAQLASLRRRSGLKPLQTDPSLQKAAQAHAADMARRGYFAHVSPSGVNFDKRYLRAGYCVASFSENLAEGPQDATGALKMWVASAPHLKNILNKKYVKYGLGQSGKYWAMALAGPCVRN